MKIPSSATPETQQAFRELWAAMVPVLGPGNFDLSGRRVINASQALDPFDYVTLDQMRKAIDAAHEDVPAPLPIKPQVFYGTHAQRLALVPLSVPDGAIFFETDRAAFYQAQRVLGVPSWVLAMCRPLRTSATLPADLGTNDAGFTWFDQVLGCTLRWSGGAWNYYLGSLYDDWANLPALALADRGFLFIVKDRGDHVYRKIKDGAVDDWVLVEGAGGPMADIWANRPTLTTTDVGFRFKATDQGNHQWRWSGTVWVLEEGIGGPMRGTLSPDLKPTLTANDVGFLFLATDFDRIYRYDGSGWSDLEGGPERDMIAFFRIQPTTAWQVCDGSAGVTISTATGGTTTFTAPNLTTNNKFIRANTVSGGTGTFAAAGATQSYYEALPYVRL